MRCSSQQPENLGVPIANPMEGRHLMDEIAFFQPDDIQTSFRTDAEAAIKSFAFRLLSTTSSTLIRVHSTEPVSKWKRDGRWEDR